MRIYAPGQKYPVVTQLRILELAVTLVAIENSLPTCPYDPKLFRIEK
jgi:hypothetical protein